MKRSKQAAWLGCVGLALTACAEGGSDSALTASSNGLRAAETQVAMAPTSGSIETSARFYALDRLAQDGLARATTLHVVSTAAGAGGLAHVRLQQSYNGVRVFGGDLVVHTAANQVLGMAGNVSPDLQHVTTEPSVSSDAAMATAKRDFAKGADAEFAPGRDSSELLMLVRDDDQPRLVWLSQFFTEMQRGRAPGAWSYFVDAKSGEVVDKFNSLHTLAEATGPGGNTKGPRVWERALDVTPKASGDARTAGEWQMDTPRVRTLDMASATTGSGTIVSGALDGIGDAAVNDAHGFAEATLAMMADWMGYNSIDGQGFKIVNRVHYGVAYENAFWDGTQMTYGDGASMFYPLSGALDVASHEINHGFTSFHSKLVYSGQSGAMNESFSDVAGTLAEFYRNGDAADFDIGKDILKSANGALRYMCDPTKDGDSIDHVSKYRNSVDVHFSSGIFNKAFCMAARRLSGGTTTSTATTASVRRAGKAWYEANANYWTARSTFVQGCKGVLDAATALGFSEVEHNALRDAFEDVGITCASGSSAGRTARRN